MGQAIKPCATLAAFLLAACNSGEPQWKELSQKGAAISVSLPVSAERAHILLQSADGQIDTRGLLDVPFVAQERPQPLILLYVFNRHTPGGEGWLMFKLVPAGDNSSRVDLTVRLPANAVTLEGRDWSISQGKVERLLKEDLKWIAAELGSTGRAQETLDRLDLHIAAIAVAMSEPAAREAVNNGVTFEDLERNLRFSREDAAEW